MKLVATAASDRRTELFRVTDSGQLEHRWLSAGPRQANWSAWSFVPFNGQVVDIAVISGWPVQIEIFVLDDAGGVWNRWWWERKGWEPADGFDFRGRPFRGEPARDIAALSAGGGHFNVFVQALDGRIAMLPHLARAGEKWLPCDSDDALGDGWWPAFEVDPGHVYRMHNGQASRAPEEGARPGPDPAR